MKAKHLAFAVLLTALVSTGSAPVDAQQISVPTPISQPDTTDSDWGVNIAIGLGVAVVAGAAIFFAVQRKSPK